MFAELLSGVGRLGKVLFGQFAQTGFPIDGHEYIYHQRDQRLIGADVRCGFLATNVLFAGGEREHEATFAILIGGLADQPSRQLADKLFASRDHPTVRAAEPRGHAERLRFHGDNIGLPRGLNDSEGHSFRDRNDQHSAMLVGDIRDRRDIFNRAQEVGRLD